MAVSGQLGLFNMPEAPRGPMSYPTKSAGPAADILQAVVEALTGAAGLPTGMDSKATRVGEMLGAVLPAGAALRGLKGARGPIKAYHGSPHDFDKFSLDKVGTGEGAQSFGRGLYFAESEDVARSYRDKLAKSDSGRMYEVAINAEPESLLGWDLPLSQQSAVVQAQLGPMVEYLKSRPLQPKVREKLESGTAKGRELYMWLSGEKSLDEARVTWPSVPKNPNEFGARALNDQGVPGIQYLDAGSRPGGVGTRNYVVFDDALIDVLRKYGLLPAAVATGAAAERAR
jgi:hypothetical protein